MIRVLLLLLQAGRPFAAGPLSEARALDGDPVDLGTGLYENKSTDFVADDIFPIAFTRTYRTEDRQSRAFGIGANHTYDIFLVGDSSRFSWVDLILPDGGRVHYVRTSPGTSWIDAVFTHTATPTKFYQSTLRWNQQWGGWDLTLPDDTLYQFPASAGAVRSSQAAVIASRDSQGNSLKFARDADGDLLQIVTPGGRHLDLSYDERHRIIQARNDRGRIVKYQYDKAGRLELVTESNGRTSHFTYNEYDRMLRVEYDGKLFIENLYDEAGRAIRQIRPDGTAFTFTYATNRHGKITQTEVCNPDGRRRRVFFNADGYIIRDTKNLGTAFEETTIYDREPGTNRIVNERSLRGRRAA